MRSLEGQLLVAPKNRTDPNFAQAVILVVRHNGQEASGVIMNRPVDERVLVFGGEENKPLSIGHGQALYWRAADGAFDGDPHQRIAG